MMRTSTEEIRVLLSHARHASTGKVIYPAQTFDGQLLDAIGNDLFDYHCVEARLEDAIRVADRKGFTEQAKILRWIRNGEYSEPTQSA